MAPSSRLLPPYRPADLVGIYSGLPYQAALVAGQPCTLSTPPPLAGGIR